MKKLTIQVLIILIITIIVVSCVLIVPRLIFHHILLWKSSADFEACADDFNVVKNYIAAEFPNETNKWLLVSSAGGQGTRLSDPDINEYLQAPSNVISSLEAIDKNGFPDKYADLDVIRIHTGRISFCVDGWYALVYSPNEKPSWVNLPNEDCEIRVKSIGEGWYHVVKVPG